MSRDPGEEVVVTAVGAVTPAGNGVQESFDFLAGGGSATGLLDVEWAHRVPVRIAAQVRHSLTRLADTETRRYDRSTLLILEAFRQVWSPGEPVADPDRLAVVIGVGMSGPDTLFEIYDRWQQRGPSAVPPTAVPAAMANVHAAVLAMEAGAHGGAHATVSACASGAEAIALGWRLIRDGDVDAVVVGGTEAPVHPVTLTGFSRLRALSDNHEHATRACRPFDVTRDGFVLGEAAACLVLERAEHAQRRAARVLARLQGAAVTSDGFHLVAPDPEGTQATRAVVRALHLARREPEEVVHWNAHATGTAAGDVAEARVISESLGSHASRVPVTALKGALGHSLGAAGAVAAALTVASIQAGSALPTANHGQLDPQAGCLDIVTGRPRPVDSGAWVSTTFGFGGHNVALVFADA